MPTEQEQIMNVAALVAQFWANVSMTPNKIEQDALLEEIA